MYSMFCAACRLPMKMFRRKVFPQKHRRRVSSEASCHTSQHVLLARYSVHKVSESKPDVCFGRLTLTARDSQDNNTTIFGNRWQQVLAQFGEEQCRCQATFRGQRCQNFKDRHFHGHQFAVGDADRVRTGDFESRYSGSIDGLHKAFCKSVLNSAVLRTRSIDKWIDELWIQSRKCHIEEILSNRTSLACLCRTPIQVVPCRHSICEICAADLSTHAPGGATLLTLKCRPFGCRWSSGKSFQIYRKPTEAGVRVLSLDG